MYVHCSIYVSILTLLPALNLCLLSHLLFIYIYICQSFYLYRFVYLTLFSSIYLHPSTPGLKCVYIYIYLFNLHIHVYIFIYDTYIYIYILKIIQRIKQVPHKSIPIPYTHGHPHVNLKYIGWIHVPSARPFQTWRSSWTR